jgi:hypothetical protein
MKVLDGIGVNAAGETIGSESKSTDQATRSRLTQPITPRARTAIQLASSLRPKGVTVVPRTRLDTATKVSPGPDRRNKSRTTMTLTFGKGVGCWAKVGAITMIPTKRITRQIAKCRTKRENKDNAIRPITQPVIVKLKG